MTPDSAPTSIALALGAGALVAAGCRAVRVPAPIPLMLTGAALGMSGLGVVDPESLGPALKALITLSIGLLIFEGSLHLNKEELSRAPRAVWGLLTVGALATWAGSAWAAHALLGFPWALALLLGAALIVTGPTVVQPILRSLKVSPRVHTALTAEAVLIDPLGVVATVATLEVIKLYSAAQGGVSLAAEGFWLLARPLASGAAIGVAMVLIGGWLLYTSEAGGRQ